MNSKAAQLRENGTEIVRLFSRFALGASFLSAVADRFGLWAIWSKERSLGKFRSFRRVHGRGDVSLPQFIDGVVCMGSYRRGDPLWDIAHRRLSAPPNGKQRRSSCPNPGSITPKLSTAFGCTMSLPVPAPHSYFCMVGPRVGMSGEKSFRHSLRGSR